MIKFGRRLFASVRNLLPGDLIEFGYNGKVRTGVVVTPDWKGNVDCYVFDTLNDVPEELAEHILYSTTLLEGGDLYVDFGKEFEFKSFKQSGMAAIQQIQFSVETEEKEQDTEQEQEDKAEEVKEILQDIYIDNRNLPELFGGNLYGE
jgi:hypothetical protein